MENNYYFLKFDDFGTIEGIENLDVRWSLDGQEFGFKTPIGAEPIKGLRVYTHSEMIDKTKGIGNNYEPINDIEE